MSGVALAVTDWRSWAVVRRNALVFLRNWKTAFLPPALEPIVFFVAFGIGLREHVDGIAYHGAVLDYSTYVAPGLIAYAAFSTPYYEALYSAYVRMFYQKTWDGILATQVELPNVVWGEIFWGGLRGAVNVSIVCVVIAVFVALGIVQADSRFLLVMPLFAFFAGCAFAAFALIFTALVPAIDHMNYPVFLIGWPVSLASNTFFPVVPESPFWRFVVELNPVYQLAELSRALLVGGPVWHHFGALLITSSCLLIPSVGLAMVLTRRRVLGPR